jgi:hypothetical protein
MPILFEIFSLVTALAQCRSSNRFRHKSGAKVSSIRCEQGTKNSDGLDVWLSRGAMLGFTAALTVELSTGKGLLEVPSPIKLSRNKLTGLIGYKYIGLYIRENTSLYCYSQLNFTKHRVDRI